MAPSLSRNLRTGLFYVLRTVFRITPMPDAARDGLRQRFLDRYSNLAPPSPKGQISEEARVHRPYVRSDERAIGYVPYSKGELPDPLPATLVAFYLPQFHTIPENDEWWGKGFTEWRNVTRALPQFEGHHQPKLPGDLGFYDLRNPDVMREQARLAREYGVSAFCFYFYWFGGKTLLETPLRNWLADSAIDLQFCLCWANEKWTRTWDGRGDEILIDQKHGPEDDLAFIAHVAEYMRDPRYLRVDGKPMLLVYRPGLFPDMVATAARWRKWCSENDIGEIHLAYVQSFERPDPHTIGFDAAVEFPPNLTTPHSLSERQQLINPDFAGDVFDWREVAKEFRLRPPHKYLFYPGVNPGWDNEARRPAKGRTFLHASHREYRDWLESSIIKHKRESETRPLIFINAWNEWAEGAVLEPDASQGYAGLEATRQALLSSSHAPKAPIKRLCVIVHAWYVDAFDEIISELVHSGVDWELVVTTSDQNLSAIQQRASQCPFPATIMAVENRGRDILPFLRIANRLLDKGTDVVLKLHTKRSPHLAGGEAWRRELTGRLLSGSRARAISSAFDKDPGLGLVGPEGHILPIAAFIGANGPAITRMWNRMGMYRAIQRERHFISGSMFWVRLNALKPLLDVHLHDSDFEAESGQIDGTLAHALERMFGLCTEAAGFSIQSAATICGVAELPADDYPYARSSNQPLK